MTADARESHAAWIIFILAISAAALAAMFYLTHYRFPPLTGRSTVGHAFGIIAAALIFIVTFYSARKARPVWNFGSLETWLKMHIWLGVLSLGLALAHTGLQFKATLAVVTFVLLVLVVLSGAVGYALYLMVPSRMAEAEEQVVIPEEVAARLQELKDELYSFCEESGEAFMPVYEKVVAPLYERGPQEKVEVPPLAEVVGGIEESNLEAFVLLQESVEEVARLFGMLNVHFRYTRRLNAWLVCHIPVSVGLLVFLVVHIVTMLMY